MFVTGDIFYTHYIFSAQESTLQLKIYTIILVILVLLSWIVLFSRLNKAIKLALILIVILFNYSGRIVPDVKYAHDYETCLDMNICTEGLEIKTIHGKIKINKETCLKYNYQWNDSQKTCAVN